MEEAIILSLAMIFILFGLAILHQYKNNVEKKRDSEMRKSKESSADIWTEVKVKENQLENGTKSYTIKFDGTVNVLEHKPNENELYFFKQGVLSERERIWDDVQRKLLKH